MCVDEDVGVDLRAKADTEQAAEVVCAFEIPERGEHAVHPVARVLLDMARARAGGRIGPGKGRQRIADEVHQDGLDRTRPHVDTDQGGLCHAVLPSTSASMAFSRLHPV